MKGISLHVNQKRNARTRHPGPQQISPLKLANQRSLNPSSVRSTALTSRTVPSSSTPSSARRRPTGPRCSSQVRVRHTCPCFGGGFLGDARNSFDRMPEERPERFDRRVCSPNAAMTHVRCRLAESSQPGCAWYPRGSQ
jgi:hypothetical protein